MLPLLQLWIAFLKNRGWLVICWLHIAVTIGLIGRLFANPSVREKPGRDRPTVIISPSPALRQRATEKLFAHANSMGAIAVGVAEGTRTINGGYTSLYFGHSDPGNAQYNLGTFAYQHGAHSPEDADRRQLRRIHPWIVQLQQEAKLLDVPLETFELVAGIDLMNQSPAAGKDYIHHLKLCRDFSRDRANAILCARIRSFVNPQTGKLEASGLGSRRRVKQDQERRIRAIQRVLQYQ